MRMWPLWRAKCRSCADLRATCDAQLAGLTARVRTAEARTASLWAVLDVEERAAWLNQRPLPVTTPRAETPRAGGS